MEKETVKLRSLINKYFSEDLLFDLYKITMYTCDNNTKGIEIKNVLEKYGFVRYIAGEEEERDPNDKRPRYTLLGSGTNRYGILIDGYAVKIALDKDGMIDNQREMLYGKELYPAVVKVYECMACGLILVCEYVTIFESTDISRFKGKMEEILSAISDNYLVGDAGITKKNYVNWGIRMDGSICILDFAYIYKVSFNLFKCSCDGTTLLTYDDNFEKIICRSCNRKYDFKDIRKRVTKQDQKNEIGDIRRISYVLHKPEERKEFVPEFVPPALREKVKEESPTEKMRKAYRRDMKRKKQIQKYGRVVDKDLMTKEELARYEYEQRQE